MGLILNLGCGFNKMDGAVNVDHQPDCLPDRICDLNDTPWALYVPPVPAYQAVAERFFDNSVSEIYLNHVLEHLGQDPDTFSRIVREVYRVCEPGARIHVTVPHPRHDDFLGDPTHVRPITPELWMLLSKKNCRAFKEANAANTPLADYWDVDFEVVEYQRMLDPRFQKHKDDEAFLERLSLTSNNVIKELRFVLKVIKEGSDDRETEIAGRPGHAVLRPGHRAGIEPDAGQRAESVG